MSIGRIQSASHVGCCKVQLINVFKVHWDPLMKDTLEVQGRILLIIFSHLLPQYVID